MKNNNIDSQKFVALSIILLLFFLYKVNVLDPYVEGKKPQGHLAQTQGAGNNSVSAPVALSVPSPTQSSAASGGVLPGASVAASEVIPTSQQVVSSGLLVVRTDTLEIAFTVKGGRVQSLKLNDHAQTVDRNSPRLDLIPHNAGVDYPLPLGVRTATSQDLLTEYSLVAASGSFVSGHGQDRQAFISGSEQLAFELRGTLSDGTPVTKIIRLLGRGYFFDVKVLVGDGGIPFELEWTRYIADNDPLLHGTFSLGEFVWFDGNKANRQVLSSTLATSAPMTGLNWLTFAEQYFMVTMIPASEPVTGVTFRNGGLFGIRAGGEKEYKIYAGPKSYSDLQVVGKELQRNVNLGKTGFISAPLLALLHLLFALFGNYGVAVVSLTIIVKFLTYPLSHTAFKQMKAMQDLAPEMKRIRETVKEQAAQQQEIMKLYQTKKVNPMGGCLPMFLQLPIFIGLYSALSLDVGLRHAPFAFWINDLSAKESLPIFGFGVPVMVLLMIMSMMIQQWITPMQADPTQKKIMMFMPLIMGFIFMNMPAGLTLYFLTNSIISIAQTQGMYGSPKVRATGFQMTVISSLVMFVIVFVLARAG